MSNVTTSGAIYITQELGNYPFISLSIYHLSNIVIKLGKQIEHETDHRHRQFGIWLTEQYIRSSKADFTEYIPVIYKYLLSRIAENEPDGMYICIYLCVYLYTIYVSMYL
jgi:hypothetical protein